MSISQRVSAAVIYKVLGLDENPVPFFVAPSTNTFTLDAFFSNLPAGLHLPKESCQLNFSSYIPEKTDTRVPGFSAGTPIEQSETLFGECDSSASVLVDARADLFIPPRFRERYQLPQLERARKQLSQFVDNEEPGFLDICDWGPFFWCLYAHAMARGGNSAVLLEANVLNDQKAAQTLLIRSGLIEKICYLTILDDSPCSDAILIVLSSGNTSITFEEFYTSASRHVNVSRLDEVIAENDLDQLISFSTMHSTRDLLKNHCSLSLNDIKLIGIHRGYPANLQQLYVRIPPYMQRESTQSSDIDAITVRRISSRDFSDGLLLPAEAIDDIPHGESEGELRLSPSMFARYGLRSGDIVVPRILGRSGFTNLLVIGVQDASQNLVSSHNTMVLRPHCETMTEEERVAYSEMMAAYLTAGHGAQIIDALADGRSLRNLRPSGLEKVEVPPALDYRTAEYGENANDYVELSRSKKAAEAALTQAHRDLDNAKTSIVAKLDMLA